MRHPLAFGGSNSHVHWCRDGRTGTAHMGEAYENVLVPKNNANWRGPWDCAEFMSWLVYQEGGFLYGCIDDGGNPATIEAYTGAWVRIPQPGANASPSIRRPARSAASCSATRPHRARWGTSRSATGPAGRSRPKATPLALCRMWFTAGAGTPAYSSRGFITKGPAPVSPCSRRPRLHRWPAVSKPRYGAEDTAGAVRPRHRPRAHRRHLREQDGGRRRCFPDRTGIVVDGEVGPQTAAALGIQL